MNAQTICAALGAIGVMLIFLGEENWWGAVFTAALFFVFYPYGEDHG